MFSLSQAHLLHSNLHVKERLCRQYCHSQENIALPIVQLQKRNSGASKAYRNLDDLNADNAYYEDEDNVNLYDDDEKNEENND